MRQLWAEEITMLTSQAIPTQTNERPMHVEDAVSTHYSQGDLIRTILEAARAVAGDTAQLTAADLAPVDEFHIGGRAATDRFLPALGLHPELHALDVGSGIGGTARYAAERYGCRITGVDLTEEYCQVARALSREVGLESRTQFQVGSALQLPFADGSFDAAYTIHVAMNIADKAALYREVRRVLRPGAAFSLYDILAAVPSPALRFPVPWATTAETSFLATREEVRAALELAGFEVVAEQDRTPEAREFFDRLTAGNGGPPPLGIHLLMGDDSGPKLRNMVENVRAGLCGPVEIHCRAA
jgi:cyclopropane fatty-acyl-phospholipid synthase-like methyltransferase